jgi:hypothetical protein
MRTLPSPLHHPYGLPVAGIGRVLACLSVATLGLIQPGATRAETVIPLEAEDMSGAHNAGGAAISYVGCTAARGGLAVDGVDSPGDYIEWPLSLAQDFVFRDSLRTAGAIGVVRQFAILFLPAGGGPPAASDTLVTLPGAGIG